MGERRGFTLLEMTIATALFAAGALFVYSTFSGVTRSSRSATVRIDLGSQNKRALTRLYNELQASSVRSQKSDNIDQGTIQDEERNPDGTIQVFLTGEDDAAPFPQTIARFVDRDDKEAVVQGQDSVKVGGQHVQAREMQIPRSSWLRFRKVVGYMFSDGEIGPEWSRQVRYRVNDRRQLVRRVGVDGRDRVVANDVDVFDVDDTNPDGTIRVTLVTAKRDPTGAGWRRYANALTIHPKN